MARNPRDERRHARWAPEAWNAAVSMTNRLNNYPHRDLDLSAQIASIEGR